MEISLNFCNFVLECWRKENSPRQPGQRRDHHNHLWRYWYRGNLHLFDFIIQSNTVVNLNIFVLQINRSHFQTCETTTHCSPSCLAGLNNVCGLFFSVYLSLFLKLYVCQPLAKIPILWRIDVSFSPCSFWLKLTHLFRLTKRDKSNIKCTLKCLIG